MTDITYVYGAQCTWHGPFSATHSRPRGSGGHVSCCPHCRGMLFGYPNKASWDNAVAAYEKQHPGYAEFTEWLGNVGKCFPNLTVARDAWKETTGKSYE